MRQGPAASRGILRRTAALEQSLEGERRRRSAFREELEDKEGATQEAVEGALRRFLRREEKEEKRGLKGIERGAGSRQGRDQATGEGSSEGKGQLQWVQQRGRSEEELSRVEVREERIRYESPRKGEGKEATEHLLREGEISGLNKVSEKQLLRVGAREEPTSYETLKRLHFKQAREPLPREGERGELAIPDRSKVGAQTEEERMRKTSFSTRTPRTGEAARRKLVKARTSITSDNAVRVTGSEAKGEAFSRS